MLTSQSDLTFLPYVSSACRLDYCLMCDLNSNRCLQCLENTVLFEYRCYACPLATVAIEALEQEHELELEEEDARARQIECE